MGHGGSDDPLEAVAWWQLPPAGRCHPRPSSPTGRPRLSAGSCRPFGAP